MLQGCSVFGSDQSEASIQVTWLVSANERPVRWITGVTISHLVMVLPTFSWIFMCYSWVAGGSQGNVLTRLTHMIRETEPKLGRQDLENIYNKHSSVSWSINGPEKHEKIVNQAELRLTTWAVCSSNPVKVIVTDAGCCAQCLSPNEELNVWRRVSEHCSNQSAF